MARRAGRSTPRSSVVAIGGEFMVPAATGHAGSAKAVRARVGSGRRYGCRMLDRFKVAAREKLKRVLAEVVAAEHAQSRQQQDLHAELLDAVNRLDQSIGAVVTRIDDMEYRARRDLSYAQDSRTAQESAAFVLEHMPTTTGLLGNARHAAVRPRRDQGARDGPRVRGGDRHHSQDHRRCGGPRPDRRRIRRVHRPARDLAHRVPGGGVRPGTARHSGRRGGGGAIRGHLAGLPGGDG